MSQRKHLLDSNSDELENQNIEAPQTWTETYLAWKGATLSEKQRQLLTEGPKSLTDSWALGAMKYDYTKHFGRNRW